ncbi:hypothetical protein BDV37DRAFT_294023 [Aspergillus pseudonomiae]|uniref:Fusaric acid resistance protein-like-domain-containing protein n=1 Tax=Aspergillus pseudonomiae TaxID=1506151 RepID=A0A5N7DDN9_9EURO|nr:uncharacterized protein BDV37DRAFT_294023 [Aspergillus pseudonomiae]KAE8404359.1 hypothetical protein BDV37DRAFT_294023 [Aspergillus pseudonomiae]
MSERPPPATIDSNANNAIPKNSFRLPAFLDHFNARELKVFFRCWVGIWVASLLIFITPSLTSIGTATFFASMVLLILPPSGIVFIYLLGALTLIIGMCLAWAWGVITMKAAFAARPAADTQARLASLQQTAVAQANATGLPPASVVQQLIYDGYMLDTRVTAVTFCLICTFIYFMARLRASNPKAALTSVFGIIISDLFLNFIPLLPSFSGTLPVTLVKPAAIGVGLGFACSVLFFPRSTSHVVLDSMEDILELLQQPLAFTSVTLGKKALQPDIDRLRKTHARIIQKYREMEPGLAFLPLDFSVGLWGPEEVASFKEPMRQAVAAIILLLEFHIGRIHGEARTDEILREHAEQTKEAVITDEKHPHKVGAQQLSQLVELLEGLRCPDSQQLSQEVVDELVRTSAMAIDACLEGLAVTRECLHMVNCRRWVRRASPTEREELYQRSQTALENLRKAHSGFLHDMTELLIGHFAPTTNGDSRDQRKLGALVVGMVFEEHVCTTITRTEALLARVSTAFHDSKGTKLWWPTSLRYAASWAFRKKAKTPTAAMAVEDDPDEAEDLTKVAQEKLRISRGYRPKHRSPLGRAILGTYHWFTSNEGVFALRMVVVTIALGIPGVIPHTAAFYYREKGLWGLIMAQTGLLVYMSEFTFSTIGRLIGTVAGGVLGLLAWYIGSANGPGNPYGLSAVMAVLLAIFMWIRLYVSPSLLQGAIMGGATFMLVVAYSYDDTHIPQYGNPGVGYTVFWRRLLLVLIGVAAATIVQLFPRPPSAARHICKTLSHTIRTLSDHYALLLSCWGRSRHDGRVIAESITLQLSEGLVMLDGPIEMLRFDFSSSRFDSESLGRVKLLCHAMNRNLGQLLVLSGNLPSEFQHRLTQQTALLDHQCIGEIMAVLGMCEQALKTGDALPEILPTPLVRRAFDYWQSHPTEIDFSPDTVRDEHYRRFCVAMSAYLKFLGTIDELVLVIKGVLGEAHLVSHELGDFV